MPMVADAPVEAYAFCPDPRCPGYTETRVPGLRRVMSWSFIEGGGDLPGEEKSVIQILWGEGIEPPDCEHCGRRMDLSENPRPEYARLSGQDPLRLLNLDQQQQIRDAQMDALRHQNEVSDLRATVAEQGAQIQQLLAALTADKPEPRRTPSK